MADKRLQDKISFHGVILSVQPRSNVWRYRLDNRTHSLTGYNIFLRGTAEGLEKDFAVAISEKQQQKLRFHIGDEISGTAWTKMYPKLEYADYYRVGGLKKISEAPMPDEGKVSPWIGEVPELSVYDWRGCRMLDSRLWKGKCFTCKWACMANVAIEYNWGVTQKFRFESFCYGPKNCKPGGRDYMITERVPGEDCTHCMDDPERLCDTIAINLRMLHDQPFDECPIQDRITGYIRSVLNGYASGKYEHDLFEGLWEFPSDQAAWEAAREGMSSLELFGG